MISSDDSSTPDDTDRAGIIGYVNRETGETPTTLVVQLLSTKLGIEAEDLPALTDAINADALDNLFKPTAAGKRDRGRIKFSYLNHKIIITADGRVEVHTDGSE